MSDTPRLVEVWNLVVDSVRYPLKSDFDGFEPIECVDSIRFCFCFSLSLYDSYLLVALFISCYVMPVLKEFVLYDLSELFVVYDSKLHRI